MRILLGPADKPSRGGLLALALAVVGVVLVALVSVRSPATARRADVPGSTSVPVVPASSTGM